MCIGCVLPRYCGGECSFIADNADFMVIDLNVGDDSAQIGLAGLGVAGLELILDKRGERLHSLRRDHAAVIHLSGNAIQRGLGSFALDLEELDALLELVIQIDNPVLTSLSCACAMSFSRPSRRI